VVFDPENPTPGNPGARQSFAICAVLGQKGSRHVQFASWLYDDVIVVNRRPFVNLRSIDELERPTFDEMLVEADLPLGEFKEHVEQIALFVLEMARNPATAEAVQNPHMAANNERRRGANAGVTKKFSLFKVQRLTPIREAERTNGREGQKGKTFRLTRRISVVTYSRKQAFGPRAEGRTRQVTIQAHLRGPLDGLPLHPLVKIKQ
jgi:hypothetical protein